MEIAIKTPMRKLRNVCLSYPLVWNGWYTSSRHIASPPRNNEMLKYIECCLLSASKHGRLRSVEILIRPPPHFNQNFHEQGGFLLGKQNLKKCI